MNRTADVPIAGFVEAQQTPGRAPDPNAPAGPNAPPRVGRRGQPELGVNQWVRPVEGSVDCEGVADAPRPATEIPNLLGGSPASHELDARERLDRAHEHAGPDPVRLAREVEAVRRSID